MAEAVLAALLAGPLDEAVERSLFAGLLIPEQVSNIVKHVLQSSSHLISTKSYYVIIFNIDC